MAQALNAGRVPPRRRTLFGLLDADGWGWATVKAAFWFVVIIVMLAYIPDRAYYFTVNRTLDVGLLAWSPVNFCPAENKTLPCPAPLGAVVPWEPAPTEASLPAPRTHGVTAQLGTNLLFIGGTDGTTPVDSVYLATVKDNLFGRWGTGPTLPAPRSDVALASVSGTVYLLGGLGADGKPTDTVWSITADATSGALGDWTPVAGVTLPEARSGAAAIAVADGLVVLGGRDANGTPTATVWKSTLKSDGTLGPFEAQQPLAAAIAGATAVQVGDFLWVYGGTDANGPSGAVQRGSLGTGIPVVPGATAVPNATPAPQKVLQWAVSNGANLPAARADATGFSANGVMYLVGGNDGTADRSEVYWTIPDAKGNLDGWKHLEQTDLPAGGLSGAAMALAGPHAFLVGGHTTAGLLSSVTWANLAPQAPFFQLGLVGAVVPALQINGEIGQQLGYLNAAGAGTLDFIILLAIGWGFAHKAQVRAWVDRRRARRRG
jgi:hypothetical protein